MSISLQETPLYPAKQGAKHRLCLQASCLQNFSLSDLNLSLSTLLESPVALPELPRAAFAGAVSMSLAGCCATAALALTPGEGTEGLQALQLLSQTTLFCVLETLFLPCSMFLRGILVVGNVP